MGTWPPQLRTAMAAAGAAGVVGLALAGLSWTGPLDNVGTADSTAARRMTFSYTAAVRRSPAYDGTTVRSPATVFRRLTNTVDVHFDYTGEPGSVAVDAELSTPSGWRSTVPLAQPATFTADSYQGSVRLDLKALEAKAIAAAKVTGLPGDPITVRVITRVRTAGGQLFTPALALRLTELQLAAAGDADSFTVIDKTTTRRVTRTARSMSLLGRRASVATVRVLSAFLLLAALLAAALMSLLARRTTPDSEGAGIRRRYAPLLVPVDPMPTPPGRPVIDVPEFATLARIAERYGLLVLHWSRSDVETFVVQDESTTYRYRTGVADSGLTTAGPLSPRADVPRAPAAPAPPVVTMVPPPPTAPTRPANHLVRDVLPGHPRRR